MENLSPFVIYIIMQADMIVAAINNITYMSGCLSLVSVFVWHISKEEVPSLHEKFTKIMKICILVFCISGVLSTFIPNTKTMAAVTIIPAITKSETVNQFPSELLDVLKVIKIRLTTKNSE